MIEAKEAMKRTKERKIFEELLLRIGEYIEDAVKRGFYVAYIPIEPLAHESYFDEIERYVTSKGYEITRTDKSTANLRISWLPNKGKDGG